MGSLKKDRVLGLIEDNVFDEISRDRVYQELEERNQNLDNEIDKKFSKVSKEDVNYFKTLLFYGKVDIRFSGVNYLYS